MITVTEHELQESSLQHHLYMATTTRHLRRVCILRENLVLKHSSQGKSIEFKLVGLLGPISCLLVDVYINTMINDL